MVGSVRVELKPIMVHSIRARLDSIRVVVGMVPGGSRSWYASDRDHRDCLGTRGGKTVRLPMKQERERERKMNDGGRQRGRQQGGQKEKNNEEKQDNDDENDRKKRKHSQRRIHQQATTHWTLLI